MQTAIESRASEESAFVLRQLATMGGRAIFVDRAQKLVPVYGQPADEFASQTPPPVSHRDDEGIASPSE